MSAPQAFTYWETSPYRPTVPPYILCGLVSMQRALGERFRLITRQTLADDVDFDFASRDFYFAAVADRAKDSISRITAKSDFIRFKRILDQGGIWIDADSIVLDDFLPVTDPMLDTGRLIWHSEQFFGALKGNELVRDAVENMLGSSRQHYANPGKIKDRLPAASNEQVTYLPSTLLDPTGDASYRAKDWETASRGDIPLAAFLRNPACRVVKIYNSMLLTKDVSQQTVAAFLQSGSLMAQVCLHVESSIEWRVVRAAEVAASLAPDSVRPGAA
jgi:hypothetical protein